MELIGASMTRREEASDFWDIVTTFWASGTRRLPPTGLAGSVQISLNIFTFLPRLWHSVPNPLVYTEVKIIHL